MATCITLAGVIQRFLVVFISGIADTDIAEACEKPAVSGIPGRHDAVEHVDPVGNAGNQIFRCADTHQVMRHVGRQTWADVGQDSGHFFFRLTN